MRQTRMWTAMALIVPLVALACTSCTHAQFDIFEDERVSQDTSTASVAQITPDGRVTGSYQGLGPTLLEQDANGNWLAAPGPMGVLSYAPSSGLMYLVSPKDARMKGVKFTPAPPAGQPAFEAEEIEVNLSEPLTQHTAELAAVMPTLENMTRAEAEATVKRMEAAGEITKAIADLLLRYVVPTLPAGGEE